MTFQLLSIMGWGGVSAERFAVSPDLSAVVCSGGWSVDAREGRRTLGDVSWRDRDGARRRHRRPTCTTP